MVRVLIVARRVLRARRSDVVDEVAARAVRRGQRVIYVDGAPASGLSAYVRICGRHISARCETYGLLLHLANTGRDGCGLEAQSAGCSRTVAERRVAANGTAQLAHWS